ncbi:MAG TPA: sn-glycerol-3-phosphate ABC transporter ATP-binding protein UgpC [Devosia sp.]|jgi:ABC-type sugar transport system ATPase subunit|uniref:ABC transporter ATP-binding protein n=1 Tax=Devosia sp. TaxID=1871048 RepID=UPI002DDCCC75|nr:sn-glycerol-3-phosphate ABC transporter ATP-binding protein UgpC [Devosia sp.]HEV2517346.1 sn-glycerol-3-phosphate ABC transporter ATP-binding protein UgpC [Devosia sp.]
MAFLDISSVSKSFGSVSILRDVDLSIEEGEFVVFVGPSGCGKSTLLRMISGLEEISAGTISIAGEVMNEIEPADRGAAMVFQSYALYPHMTTFENVSFGLRMAHKARDFIAGRVNEAATILQLEKLLARKPGQLSGGQKQRVAIGRAIVREPRVFLFDEPLSNLDAELRVQMRAELTELHKRLGTTMIYVTHDQIEAMTLADKMVVMAGGLIQQAGPPLTLYDDPDNQFVAGFVGSPKMNFLAGQLASVDAGSVKLSGVGGAADITLPIGGVGGGARAVTLGVRPEHLTIAGDDAPGALSGRVTLVEELGAESFVHLTVADGTPMIVRARRDAARAGSRVRLGIDAGRALLFERDGQRIRGSLSLQ